MTDVEVQEDVLSSAPPVRRLDPLPLLIVQRTSERRSLGLRSATYFPVTLQMAGRSSRCHAVELSGTGIVLEHSGGWTLRGDPKPVRLELELESRRRVRVLARPVRPRGARGYAFKFVAISDVDRLSLVEHVDREQSAFIRFLSELRSRESSPAAAREVANEQRTRNGV